jgi:hypothetical protein
MTKVLLGLAILSLTNATFAATTGTLLLQGVVAQKISVAVVAEPGASTLDLSTSQTDLAVASVNEVSNAKNGYKMTITSANFGNLKRTDGTDALSYSLKYNGAAVALGSAAGTTITNSSPSAVSTNKSVTISYTGAETLVEGTYADTVTFTIAAN